jgi:hypothetical protein
MYALLFDKAATVTKTANASYVCVWIAVGFVTHFCVSIQREKKNQLQAY